MRRPASLAAVSLLASASVLIVPGFAVADRDETGDQTCPALSSGKEDTTGDPMTVTVHAPAGKVITGYCVKAGSTKQGDGPRMVSLDRPLTTVVLSYPDAAGDKGAKAVSHYSLTYADASTPSPPTPPTPPTTPVVPPDPQPNPPAVDRHGHFDWNWRYAGPTCTALVVAYPSNIPGEQSNDVNVRVWTKEAGEVTLNYHLDGATWSGTQAFVYDQHALWPAGVTEYAVVWTQVAGSNYHYGESFHNAPVEAPVKCRVGDDGDPATYDAPLAVTEIDDWRAGTTTVRRGRAASADLVTLDSAGLETLDLQRNRRGAWSTIRRIVPSSGTVRVTFPRERRKGRVGYRLVVSGSESVTGAQSPTFTVRVR
ncbi:hypothetical protein [Nocardioides sp. SYSU DS0663]|uniref:hypothetical protein n=1 Tax=Nocardioides sp. SYSU DS0663 TaxID=3416445 RepID=UPI003F4B5C16